MINKKWVKYLYSRYTIKLCDINQNKADDILQDYQYEHNFLASPSLEEE